MKTVSYSTGLIQFLKKNRTLLSKFNPDGKVKISKKKMLNAGFNFDYYTHTYHTQNGKSYIFCYEFGYLTLDDDDFLLVKREEKWLSNAKYAIET